jgi:pimeloyl-ACP methyl ester carboxylesterase
MLKLLAAAAAAALAIAAPAAAQADPNKLFADSRVVVRDRFSDEIVGKGPDLVFIPGLSSSRATWKATAERLRGKYRLHLINIAGFAGEPARANAEGEVFAPTIEAIDAYLVQQKLTPAVVVGHSLGGSMVIYLAQKHPDHLKKAMVVDSMPFLALAMVGPQATSESVKPMATMMRDGMAKGGEAYAQGVKVQVARMAASDADKAMIADWGLASDPGVSARAFYDLLLLDQRPGMAAIATPITLLYPDNAKAGGTGAMMDGYYRAAFRDGHTVTLKRIDGAQHFIMLDQPQAFADALDAFLAP